MIGTGKYSIALSGIFRSITIMPSVMKPPAEPRTLVNDRSVAFARPAISAVRPSYCRGEIGSMGLVQTYLRHRKLDHDRMPRQTVENQVANRLRSQRKKCVELRDLGRDFIKYSDPGCLISIYFQAWGVQGMARTCKDAARNEDLPWRPEGHSGTILDMGDGWASKLQFNGGNL